MLSNTCKYAIRAVTYLAVHADEKKMIGIKAISKDLDIPTPFLGKILQTFVKHKMLSSVKGPHGGFGLLRKAKDISLLDIIEIIDGTDLFDECLIGLRYCKEMGKSNIPCPINDKYAPISKQLYELFKTETIEDLKKEITISNGKVEL